MARARNIKPGFFKNELLAEMPPETRLLFMGLWCLADREGRFEDRPKKIKMELFPCDSFSIEDSLALLAKDGFLLRYEVDGKRYAQVVNFTKHQMPHHKEVPSEIPAPPGCAQVTRHSYDVPAKVREEVFARDGNACLKCGALESLSLDHIQPLGFGGDNSINNLQTLCTSCNSSKGNTTKDYRKSNVEPTLSQRQTKQGAPCPSESGFSDSLNPDSLIEAKASSSSAKPDALPPCPHAELIDLFGQHLPMLPQPKVEAWSGARAKALQTRWRWVLTAKKRDGTRYATNRNEALAWFSRYFNFVARSDFLSGRDGKWTGCDLGWLANETNFAKVIQGNYDNRELEAA